MWQLFNCRECLTSFSTMTHQRTSTTDGGQTTLVKLREELSECEVSIGFKHFHFLKDVCLCTAGQLQGVKILILDIFQCGVALSTAPKKAVERSTESLITSRHLDLGPFCSQVWRTQTFRVYEGGRWWRPPSCEASDSPHLTTNCQF